MKLRIIIGGSDKVDAKLANFTERPEKAKNVLNIEAPTRMIAIIAVVEMVSSNDSVRFLRFNRFDSRAMIREARAPTEPASVGVTMPEYIPPTTNVNIRAIPHISLNESIVVFQLTPWDLLPSFGFIAARIVIIEMKTVAVSTPGRNPAINVFPADSPVASA